MTRRRDLERHRRSLGEIREIMNSMKTLAYLETRKLNRFLAAQQSVVRNIEDAAEDFLGFFPTMLPETGDETPVYLIIGSERGFCGDFNHELLRHLDSTSGIRGNKAPLLLPVGRKLHLLLEHDARVAAYIDGVNVVEEAYSTLNQIVHELTELRLKHGPVSLSGLYHGEEGNIAMQILLPPLQHVARKPQRFSYPPELNLPPRDFLMKLADQYLFAALYEMLYTSLMSENQLRVSHLDGAVQYLDDESANLARRSNTLRQEEIIEEIEVILLSAANLNADEH
ncbi:MAG: F0F1 ATP synthase subunit gamma [Acidiferrobacterales bacterium]|jgi:F-type H+-transporting ATPase subunit gamma|nr:F0F1 ATP synthase subunit gamma [Acidiferrobacterales bacterium]